MRLFSFRRAADGFREERAEGRGVTYRETGRTIVGSGGGAGAGPWRERGVGVGRLHDDGSVEVARGTFRPAAELLPAPAVPRPGKIVCIGLNYRDHVEEQHIEPPSRPVLFAKFANAVIADGEPIVRPPGTHALDLEAELGVVMGKRARRVARADAMGHVLGYVVVNDVTARDWQGNRAALRPGEHGDGQWLRAKGSDTFCPIGPVLVTADELPDVGSLRVRSWRIPSSGPRAGDEVPMQDGTTADMIFDVPTLIEFVSAVITLEPGDVISTGTPSGVGVFRDPPVFLEPGDAVRCEVEGIGSVRNPIVDWSAPEATPAWSGPAGPAPAPGSWHADPGRGSSRE